MFFTGSVAQTQSPQSSRFSTVLSDDGILSVDSEGYVTWEEPRSSSSPKKLRLEHKAFLARDKLVYLHHPQKAALFIATLPTPSDQKIGIQLSWERLTGETRSGVMSGLTWPFAFAGSQESALLLYTFQGKIYASPLNWLTGDVAEGKVVGTYDGKISEPADIFRALKQSQASTLPGVSFSIENPIVANALRKPSFEKFGDLQKQLIGSLRPNFDLVNELQNGRRPFYKHDGVSEYLAKRMCGTKNTWALLRYQKGQRPEELVVGFVEDLIAKKFPSLTPQTIDAVLAFPNAKPFRSENPTELREIFETVRSAIQGRSVVLVFQDFPTDNVDIASGGGSASQLFDKLWEVLGPCIQEGTCRIIVTMREAVYQHFASQNLKQTLTEEVESLPIAQLQLPQSEALLRTVIASLQKQGIPPFEDRALTEFALFSTEVDPVTIEGLESPDKEIHLLTKFVEPLIGSKQPVIRTDVVRFRNQVMGFDTREVFSHIDQLQLELLKGGLEDGEVIGQLCEELRSIDLGVERKQKPLGYFVLVGPTSTAKDFARRLGELLVPKEDYWEIQNAMEFSTFKPQDPLTQALKRAPQKLRVIVYDVPFSEGATSILQALSGIVETGHYAHRSSDELSFKNAVVIITTSYQGTVDKKRADRALTEILRQSFSRTGNKAQAPSEGELQWLAQSPYTYVFPSPSRKELLGQAAGYLYRQSQWLSKNKGVEFRVHPEALVNLLGGDDGLSVKHFELKVQKEIRIRHLRNMENTRFIAIAEAEKIAVYQQGHSLFEAGWNDREVTELYELLNAIDQAQSPVGVLRARSDLISFAATLLEKYDVTEGKHE